MKKLGVLVLLLAVIATFQNCSPSHVVEGDYLSVNYSKGCSSIIERAYFETYYKTFLKSCLPCHGAGGESGRFLASSDFQEATSVFTSIGRATIENKARDPGHKPPNTGAHMNEMVSEAQSKWATAEASAADCGGGVQIITTEKSVPAIWTANPRNNQAWPKITWNLDTDVKTASLVGTVKMEVSIEVRRYLVANVASGYEFRNPRARILSGIDPQPAYRLRGLNIMLNDQRLTSFTLFGSMDAELATVVETLLMPGVGFAFALSPVNSTDRFALRFDSISDGSGQTIGGGGGGGGVTLPERVSYSDLVSANPDLGVFAQNCRSCHSSARTEGGLNLDNYTQARDAAVNIQARMNNLGNPMPPTGALPLDKRELINIWINSGIPQN